MPAEKFTGGDWAVNAYNVLQVIAIQEGPNAQGQCFIDGRHQVVIANVSDTDIPFEEAKQNAALLSSAQELLLCLEYAVAMNGGHGEDAPEWKKQARAAIAKARREI